MFRFFRSGFFLPPQSVALGFADAFVAQLGLAHALGFGFLLGLALGLGTIGGILRRDAFGFGFTRFGFFFGAFAFFLLGGCFG